jgi:regulator of RNase E activity RraB
MIKKNKKGVLQVLTLPIIIAVLLFLILVIGGAFVFITANKFALIGGGLVFFALMFGFRGEFNKTKAWFLGIIIVIGLIFVLGGNVLNQAISQEDVIWTVDSGRYECIEDSVETSFIKYVDQDYKFTCGETELVDDCRIIGFCMDTSFLKSKCDGAYRVDGGSWVYYGLQKDENKELTKILPGQEIEFSQRLVTTNRGIIIPANKDQTRITYEWNPYRLFTIEAGKKVNTNSQDCSLVNQDVLKKENIPAGEYDSLEKGEVRNYFLDWELKSGRKIYEEDGKEVICFSNQLYELEEQSLANGQTRKIQGDPIKFVECCPHQDDNCASDFTFVKETDKEERECTFDFQCANQGDPQFISDELGKRESCEEGICVIEEFEIECASDNKCLTEFGEGYSCSEAPNTFGKCIEGKIIQPSCGDDICGIGETFENCPSDCEEPALECGFGQTLSTETKVVGKGFLGIGKLVGLTDEVTEIKCVTAGWVIWSIMGFLVLVLGVTAILVGRKK